VTRAAALPPVEVHRRLRPMLPIIAAAGAAIGLAAASVLVLPGPGLPLIFAHLVVLVLASGAAYLLDDRAAEATAVVPQSLLRRRMAGVAQGLVVAATGWGAVALLLDRAFLSVPLAALTWEAAGLFWVGVAGAAVLSRRGEAEPGNLVASTLVLVFVGVLIGRPLRHVDLLISDSGGSAHAGWWALCVLVSAVVFVTTSRE